MTKNNTNNTDDNNINIDNNNKNISALKGLSYIVMRQMIELILRNTADLILHSLVDDDMLKEIFLKVPSQ